MAVSAHVHWKWPIYGSKRGQIGKTKIQVLYETGHGELNFELGT